MEVSNLRTELDNYRQAYADSVAEVRRLEADRALALATFPFLRDETKPEWEAARALGTVRTILAKHGLYSDDGGGDDVLEEGR